MGRVQLFGNDFISNSSAVFVGTNGKLAINRATSDDYNVGIVSRDAFDFSSGNRAVSFIVSMKNSAPSVRSSQLACFRNTGSVFLMDEEKQLSWCGSEEAFDSVLQPDCETMSQKQCTNFYGMTISSTHTIVKQGEAFSCSGSDQFGQLGLESLETIKQVAAGKDFTISLDWSGRVVLYGSDRDGLLAIPEAVSDFDEEDKPVSISSREDSYAVLHRNGTVTVVTEDEVFKLDTDNKMILQLGSKYAIDTDGNTFNLFEKESLPALFLKVDSAEIRSIGLTTSGKVLEWGDDIDDYRELLISDSNSVIDVYAGEKFSIAVLADRTVISSGNVPDDVLELLDNKSGSKKVTITFSDSYDDYPMLRELGLSNIAFGIQTDTLDDKVLLHQNSDGESTPVMRGHTELKSVFACLGGFTKGTVVAKHTSGATYSHLTTGEKNVPVEGHSFIGEDFISDKNERYKITISFSPFGKTISFRKINGSFIRDYPVKTLSIQENGYRQGRVAIYIRNANSFVLEECYIEDSIPSGILPAEIIYRDIDTAVLQSEATSLINDIASTTKEAKVAVAKLSESLLVLNSDYKKNLKEVFERLEAVED